VHTTSYIETRSYKFFSTLKAEIKATSPNGLKLDPLEALRRFGLTKFADLVDRAGMAAELVEMPVLTLFAPTNQAIDNLSPSDFEKFFRDSASYREIVQTHVAPGFIQFHMAGIEKLDAFDIEMKSLAGTKIERVWRPKPALIYSTKQENACAIPLFDYKTRNGILIIIDAVLASSEDRQHALRPWPAPGTVSPGDPRPFPEHDQLPPDFRLYGARKEIVIREVVA